MHYGGGQIMKKSYIIIVTPFGLSDEAAYYAQQLTAYYEKLEL